MPKLLIVDNLKDDLKEEERTASPEENPFQSLVSLI